MRGNKKQVEQRELKGVTAEEAGMHPETTLFSVHIMELEFNLSALGSHRRILSRRMMGPDFCL